MEDDYLPELPPEIAEWQVAPDSRRTAVHCPLWSVRHCKTMQAAAFVLLDDGSEPMRNGALYAIQIEGIIVPMRLETGEYRKVFWRLHGAHPEAVEPDFIWFNSAAKRGDIVGRITHFSCGEEWQEAPQIPAMPGSGAIQSIEDFLDRAAI